MILFPAFLISLPVRSGHESGVAVATKQKSPGRFREIFWPPLINGNDYRWHQTFSFSISQMKTGTIAAQGFDGEAK